MTIAECEDFCRRAAKALGRLYWSIGDVADANRAEAFDEQVQEWAREVAAFARF